MGKIFNALEKSNDIKKDINLEQAAVAEDKTRKGNFSELEEEPEAEAEVKAEVPKPHIESGFEMREPEPESEAEVETQEVHLPGNLDKGLVTHLKPHSFEAEQFRILKTTILFPHKGTPPRTIMVTSSAPGEGKSFVASNIAISIAKSIDEYVLLMDCDLRLPSLHTRFGFSDIPGLSEYLLEGKSLGSIIRKTAIDKLSLLPAGKPPSNPSELISSEQMRRLLHEVKDRYEDRYIIIDSPPPYLTAEANALARQVDGIIIVVKTGKTKRSDVQDLIDTYGKEKILGVVKNFADQRQGFKKHEYK